MDLLSFDLYFDSTSLEWNDVMSWIWLTGKKIVHMLVTIETEVHYTLLSTFAYIWKSHLIIPSLKKIPGSNFVMDYLRVAFHLSKNTIISSIFTIYLSLHLFTWFPNKIFPQSTTYNSITLDLYQWNIIPNAVLSFFH